MAAARQRGRKPNRKLAPHRICRAPPNAGQFGMAKSRSASEQIELLIT
jgi:hypothetical protein